jgi:hypothetical protein
MDGDQWLGNCIRTPLSIEIATITEINLIIQVLVALVATPYIDILAVS